MSLQYRRPRQDKQSPMKPTVSLNAVLGSGSLAFIVASENIEIHCGDINPGLLTEPPQLQACKLIHSDPIEEPGDACCSAAQLAA